MVLKFVAFIMDKEMIYIYTIWLVTNGSARIIFLLLDLTLSTWHFKLPITSRTALRQG